MREDVDDELADVVEDLTARLDGDHDRREVVVGQHHRGGLARDIGAREPHRDPNVGATQRRCVVDAVAGHGDDLALGPQGVGDP